MGDQEKKKKSVSFQKGELQWGLVNNTGRSVPSGSTDRMQLENFNKVLDVNLMGVIEVTLQFLPLLKKARGHVVNVANIVGRLSVTGGGYCLSKSCTKFFSNSLRKNRQPFGIKMTITEPGYFKTGPTQMDVIEADLRRPWNCFPQDVKDLYGETHINNYVKAYEFTINILCSSDISKVTSHMEHGLM
ncbi:retinol dehydrogenase 7-like [Thalassophryne amazonica]|uniref:retinol dehydrogenase 7-like n=1 Tax=Thalassophryne amazonica TaxID=390379 RepID=UPI0014721E88|nr:retinol dehydrogenase 7-like [Thalassophryne amazonica]